MRLRSFILFFLSITLLSSYAQETGSLTPSRILILLDESSSMLQPWAGGKEKHDIANQIIVRLMDSIYTVNKEVEFSLRVFGSLHGVLEHNCTDTKNEVPFSKYNKAQMEFRLDDIKPYGGTAIAYSLKEAAENDLLRADKYVYSIVLVTDGGESCDGDICGVMTTLMKNKIFFKPYILCMEDIRGLKEEYACLGNYLPVTKKADIPKAIGAIVDAFRPMLTITRDQYKTIQEMGIPSVLKMNPTNVKVEVDPRAPANVKVDPIPEPKPKDIKPKPETKPTPKPVPADTVAAVKPEEPKKSSIEVGEVIKLPPPVKMKRITVGKLQKMFVAVTTGPKAKDIAAGELKINIPEPPPALEPMKMARISPTPLKKKKMQKQEVSMETHDLFAGELKINIPEPPPVLEPMKMAVVKPSRIKKIPVNKISPTTSVTDIFVSGPVLNIKEPEVLPTAVKMLPVKSSRLKKLTVEKIVPSTSVRDMVAAAPVIKIKEPEVTPVVVEVKKEKLKMAKIRQSPIPKRHLLFVVPNDEGMPMIKLPPAPTFKPIATTAITPIKPAVNEPKKLNPAVNTGEYSVTQEDAKETSMVVYITNGKGKYFPVTPKVVMTDATTNKEVKKFTRFVDAAGQPDPIKNIATGKYYLTIEGRDDLIASVELMPNKRTRVEIVVKKYSLSFHYEPNGNRPVKEFSARVIQRNVASGRVVEQKCTEKLEFEPGNYHININTFPEEVRNIDLDGTSEGGIAIKEPGFAKFVNETKVTSITLHKQLGDKFLQFYTLNLSDPRSQHLQIQPGKYQAQFHEGPSSLLPNKVVPFTIRSNEEVEVVLKSKP